MSMPPQTPGQGSPPPSRKVKSKSSTRVYIVATVLCCILAFLVVLIGSSGGNGPWVLTARQTIAARATLSTDLFTARQIDEDLVVAGAIVGDDEKDVMKKAEKAGIDGAVAQYPLPRGGQFTDNLISMETELAEPLKPTERLVSVPSSFAASMAGTIKVGDHVDVYAVGDSNMAVANMLIQNVEVVAVSLPEDQVSSVYQRQISAAESGEELTAAELLPANPIPGVFTLRVPADRVAAINTAAAHSTIALAYRGADATDAPVTSPVDITSVLCGVSGAAGSTAEQLNQLVQSGQVKLPAQCLGG